MLGERRCAPIAAPAHRGGVVPLARVRVTMIGLAVCDAAISTSDAMCCGAVQLIPTAATYAQSSRASRHSASVSPWLTCMPSRHEKLIQACT
jgi:hypothetical protein